METQKKSLRDHDNDNVIWLMIIQYILNYYCSDIIWLNKGNLIISKIDITGNEGMIALSN